MGGQPNFQFERSMCFRPACIYFRRFISLIGAILAIINMALDIVYAYQTPYQNELLFQLTVITLGLRLLLTIGLCQYYYTSHVRNYKPKLSNQDRDEYDGDEIKETAEKAAHDGVMLYSSLHLLSYTGFYRILAIKDFKNELLFSYIIEFIFSILPQLLY